MAFLAAAIPAIAGYAGATAAAGSTMATLATVAQIGGTILSGIGAIQSLTGGNAQAKAINAAANVTAGQERAKSQRVAEQQRKQAAIVGSRARAVAGASGGGVTDPTVTGILSEIEGEGEYRALSAMYEGEDRARGVVNQGRADAYSARSQGRAGFMAGMTSVLSGAGDLFTKYSAGTSVAASASPTSFSTPMLYQSPSLRTNSAWNIYTGTR